MAVNSELAILLTAKDRAGQPLRKLQKQVSGLQKTVDTAGKSFKTLSTLVGVGAGGLGAAAVTAGFAFNSFQEQSQLAFTTILKDGAKAQKMIAGIQEVAKVTPFDTESLTRATQRLLAFGVSADDVLPTLVDISDTVSGLGGSTEMIDRVVNAFGQMTAKGKAQTEELMQLAEAGIPVWKILADNIGEISPRLAEAAASGKITQPQLIEQIQKLVSGGKLKAPQAIAMLRKGMQQQFGGLSKLQSKTAAGAASTFKDTLNQAFGVFTEGPFKEAVPILLAATEAVDAMVAGFKLLPSPVREVVSWVATFASTVGSLVSGPVLGYLIAKLGSDGLLGVLGKLAGFVRGASGPGVVLAAAWEIAKLGWDRNVKPIFDALDTYMKAFPHVSIGLGWANAQAKAVADWIMGLGGTIDTAVKVAVQWANDAARDLASWANQAAKNVRQTVQVGVEWANEAARTLATWVQNVASSVTQTVKVGYEWASQAAYELATWVQAKVGTFTQTVQVAWDWLNQYSRETAAWVAGEIGEFAQTVSTTWAWANQFSLDTANWIAGKIGEFGQLVRTSWEWASNYALDTANWIAGKLGEHWQTVKTAWEWASGGARDLANWVASHVGTMSATISLSLQWASDSVRKIYEWLTGIGAGIVRTGGLPVVNVGGGGHVPVMAAGGIVSSPTLAMIGEAGPEAVVPLSGRGGGFGNTYNVTINTPAIIGVNQLEDVVVAAIDRATRRGRIG